MGGKHVEWLSQNKLLVPSPSETLDQLYTTDAPAVDGDASKEQMLLTQKQIQSFSKTLDIPALEIELERAIWQVENGIRKREEKEKADKKEQ